MNMNEQLDKAIKIDLENMAKKINSFWTRFFCLFDKDMREQRKRTINTINSMLEDLRKTEPKIIDKFELTHVSLNKDGFGVGGILPREKK